MVSVDNFIRRGQCNRCGQCCGADGRKVWSANFPKALFHLTQEELEQQYPILALIGVPTEDEQSGSFEFEGKTLTFYWHHGLSKSKDNTECPFLEFEKDNDQYKCLLVDSSEHWRWEQGCGLYPDLIMPISGVNDYQKEYPKCSYFWVGEDEKERKLLQKRENEITLKK